MNCNNHGTFPDWMNQCPKCLMQTKAGAALPESAPLSVSKRKVYKRRPEMTQLVIPLDRAQLEALRKLAHAKGLRPATWARMKLLTEATKC